MYVHTHIWMHRNKTRVSQCTVNAKFCKALCSDLLEKATSPSPGITAPFNWDLNGVNVPSSCSGVRANSTVRVFVTLIIRYARPSTGSINWCTVASTAGAYLEDTFFPALLSETRGDQCQGEHSVHIAAVIAALRDAFDARLLRQTSKHRAAQVRG